MTGGVISGILRNSNTGGFPPTPTAHHHERLIVQNINEVEEVELLGEDPMAEDDDLAELDDLLQESMQLATAKRAKQLGRKLTTDNIAALEANALAEEALSWLPTTAIAHFVLTECACGALHSRFNSWYKVLSHKKSTATRLVQTTSQEGLPMLQHSTKEKVEVCEDCLRLSGIPEASIAAIPILASLGEAVEVTERQLTLELSASVRLTDEMLEELEKEEGEEHV